MKELIGMELDYLVDRMDDNLILHIGSKSSFIFVGNKTEYIKDISKVSKELINGAKKLLDKNRENMEKLVEKFLNPKLDKKTKEEIKIKLNGCYEQIKELRRYIKKYTPIMERKTLDMYPRL